MVGYKRNAYTYRALGELGTETHGTCMPLRGVSVLVLLLLLGRLGVGRTGRLRVGRMGRLRVGGASGRFGANHLEN